MDQKAGLGVCYYQKEFGCGDLLGENGVAPGMTFWRLGRTVEARSGGDCAPVPVDLSWFVSGKLDD